MNRVDEIALPVPASARARARPSPDIVRFERLWRAHYAAVHSHAVRRVGSRADEVVAEVFLVAWRRLDDLPRDELPWLLAASRHVIGTLWRTDDRRSRLQGRLEQQPPPVNGDSAGDLDAGLASALGQLGEIDRELLLLVYWEGLKPSRAAKALALSPAGARTRLWRARRKLRQTMLEEDLR
jgi:RNA polymerase sigma-70 factor (ECF subfamily)